MAEKSYVGLVRDDTDLHWTKVSFRSNDRQADKGNADEISGSKGRNHVLCTHGSDVDNDDSDGSVTVYVNGSDGETDGETDEESRQENVDEGQNEDLNDHTDDVNVDAEEELEQKRSKQGQNGKGQDRETPNNDKNTTDGYLCDICSKYFANRLYFKQHMRYTHKESKRLHLCDRCGFSSRRSDTVAIHMQTLHQSEYRINRPRVRSHTASKNKVTAVKERYSTHPPKGTSYRKIHKTGNFHFCQFCEYHSKRSDAVAYHRARIHPEMFTSENKPEEQASENQPETLDYVGTPKGTSYRKIHKRGKTHYCQFCGYESLRSDLVAEHRARYHPEKFADLEDKPIKMPHKIKVNKCHRKIHKRGIIHFCQFCGYKSIRKNVVAKHRAIMHPEKFPGFKDRRQKFDLDDEPNAPGVTDEPQTSGMEDQPETSGLENELKLFGLEGASGMKNEAKISGLEDELKTSSLENVSEMSGLKDQPETSTSEYKPNKSGYSRPPKGTSYRKIHKRGNIHYCQFCGYESRRSDLVAEHRARIHPEMFPELKEDVARMPFQIQVNKYHREVHKRGNFHICQFCGYQSFHSRFVAKHRAMMHPEKFPGFEGKRKQSSSDDEPNTSGMKDDSKTASPDDGSKTSGLDGDAEASENQLNTSSYTRPPKGTSYREIHKRGKTHYCQICGYESLRSDVVADHRARMHPYKFADLLASADDEANTSGVNNESKTPGLDGEAEVSEDPPNKSSYTRPPKGTSYRKIHKRGKTHYCQFCGYESLRSDVVADHRARMHPEKFANLK